MKYRKTCNFTIKIEKDEFIKLINKGDGNNKVEPKVTTESKKASDIVINLIFLNLDKPSSFHIQNLRDNNKIIK